MTRRGREGAGMQWGLGIGQRLGEPNPIPHSPRLFSSRNQASADLPWPLAGRSRLGGTGRGPERSALDDGHLRRSPSLIEGRMAVRAPEEPTHLGGWRR